MGGELPQWAVALIIMGSCITLAILLVALSKVAQYLNLVESPGALYSLCVRDR